MGTPTDNEPAAPDVGLADLLQLCRRLNQAEVCYLIYGGLACLLHGHERMTKDADIFIEDSSANIQRALGALSGWGDGYARELTEKDLRDSVMVRICDVFIVDLSIHAWRLEWPLAWARHRERVIDGVVIPYVSRDDLIRSKQTGREKDLWDIEVLRSLP